MKQLISSAIFAALLFMAAPAMGQAEAKDPSFAKAKKALADMGIKVYENEPFYENGPSTLVLNFPQGTSFMTVGEYKVFPAKRKQDGVFVLNFSGDETSVYWVRSAKQMVHIVSGQRYTVDIQEDSLWKSGKKRPFKAWKRLLKAKGDIPAEVWERLSGIS